MALHEVFSPTPAPKERIHQALVMEAAKRVHVSEYLQLRLQKGRGVGSSEYGQIIKAGEAIEHQALKVRKRTHVPGDKIEFSVDPQVIGARLILTNVPLEEYLVVRHDCLEAAKNKATKNKEEYENLEGCDEIAEKWAEREWNLAADLVLTNQVAVAAGIKTAA